MACLTGIKLLSTHRQRSCCLCPHMKCQCRLGPSRWVQHKTQVIRCHCGVVFSGAESPGALRDKSIFQRIEKWYFIQTKGWKCIFLSAHYLLVLSRRGWLAKKGYGEEGKGNTWSMPPHDSPCMVTNYPFLITALLSAMASGAVAPMLQFPSEQLQIGNKYFCSFNQDRSSMVSGHPCETLIILQDSFFSHTLLFVQKKTGSWRSCFTSMCVRVRCKSGGICRKQTFKHPALVW